MDAWDSSRVVPPMRVRGAHRLVRPPHARVLGPRGELPSADAGFLAPRPPDGQALLGGGPAHQPGSRLAHRGCGLDGSGIG